MEEYGINRKPATGEPKKKRTQSQKKTRRRTEPKEGGGKLLLDEERETGAVSLRVYAKYGKAMGGFRWVGLCGRVCVITQGANVANSLFLGYWSGNSIAGFEQGDYMAVYACESKSARYTLEI